MNRREKETPFSEKTIKFRPYIVYIYIQGVTGPHRQKIGMVGHAERIIFCEVKCTRKHVVHELCACIKVRAPRTGTN